MAEEKDPASAASGAAGDKQPAAKAADAEPTPPAEKASPPEPDSPATAVPAAESKQTAPASEAASPRASDEGASAAEPAREEGSPAAVPTREDGSPAAGPTREDGSPPAEPASSEAAASAEAAPASDADPWALYDPVIDTVAAELRLGVGTSYGEQWTAVEGRFLGWNNRAGWRCLLRLLRPPDEDVVVLVAEGPPLPGGRARVMVLGGFPAQLDAQMLRGALELGFAIGETWGPAEEPAPEPAAPAGATEEPSGNGPASG